MKRTFALVLVGLLAVVLVLSSCAQKAAEAPPKTETETAPTAPPPPDKPEPKPASFSVSGLTITPQEVTAGSSVTIEVLVTNSGEQPGTYDVNLKLDSVLDATKKVTLDGGASQKVTFTTYKTTAKSYAVSIDELPGSFVVVAPSLPPSPPPAETKPLPFSLSSTAFQDNSQMPVKYTQDGQNISPPLAWTEPPAGTKSFALIMDDPDATGVAWTHWVIFSLPANYRGLPENVPTSAELTDGALQGVNSRGTVGYRGPGPIHHYRFILYALDQQLNLAAGVTSKEQLLAAAQGDILAQAQLIGTYWR